MFALSRQTNDARGDGVEWMQGNLFGNMPVLTNVPFDTIYSVGPLDGFARWLRDQQLPGLKRIVALSSMSVMVKADSTDPAERAIAARLRESESAVIAFCQFHGVACVLLRPTLIYGAGVDRSVTALARFGERWRIFPSIPGATGLRQPIHADDLAAACIAAASTAGTHTKTFSLGGGEQLSFAELLVRIRASIAERTLSIPLPMILARIALRLLRLHPHWRYLHEGLIDRLQVDQVVDNDPVCRSLHWQPRNFEPRVERVVVNNQP